MKESEKALLPDLYEINPKTGRYILKKKKKKSTKSKVQDNFIQLPSAEPLQPLQPLQQSQTFDQPTKAQLELDELKRKQIELKERQLQLEKAKENNNEEEEELIPIVRPKPFVLSEQNIKKEIQDEKKKISVFQKFVEEEEAKEEAQGFPRIILTEEQRIKNIQNLRAQKANILRNFKTEDQVIDFYEENLKGPYYISKKDRDLEINRIKIYNEIEKINNENDKLKLISVLINVDTQKIKKVPEVPEQLVGLFNKRIELLDESESEISINTDSEITSKSSGSRESAIFSDSASGSGFDQLRMMEEDFFSKQSGSNSDSDTIIQQQEQPMDQQQQQDPSMSQKTVEIPKSKYSPKYHIESIIFYFGNNNPQWDFQLQNNIDKMNISKEKVKLLCKSLVSNYGKRFLINEVKSDGDKVELNELLQLQILFESNMIKKGTYALMKVSDLVKFQSKLSGNVRQQQPQQQPIQVIDGVAEDAQQQNQIEQMNQNVQKTIPDQNVQQPIQEIVTVTQSQISEDILELNANKHTYDNGKPIITPKVKEIEETIPAYLPDPEFNFGVRLRKKKH